MTGLEKVGYVGGGGVKQIMAGLAYYLLGPALALALALASPSLPMMMTIRIEMVEAQQLLSVVFPSSNDRQPSASNKFKVERVWH